MPTWTCTNTDVTKAKAEKSLKAIRSACFGCKTHSSDCTIAKAASDVEAILEKDALSVKDQIHAQIAGALKGARFPIKSPKDLIAAFPDGAATTCQAGDLKMTAGEAGKLLTATDFPFKSAQQVADTIVGRAGL